MENSLSDELKQIFADICDDYNKDVWTVRFEMRMVDRRRQVEALIESEKQKEHIEGRIDGYEEALAKVKSQGYERALSHLTTLDELKSKRSKS